MSTALQSTDMMRETRVCRHHAWDTRGQRAKCRRHCSQLYCRCHAVDTQVRSESSIKIDISSSNLPCAHLTCHFNSTQDISKEAECINRLQTNTDTLCLTITSMQATPRRHFPHSKCLHLSKTASHLKESLCTGIQFPTLSV